MLDGKGQFDNENLCGGNCRNCFNSDCYSWKPESDWEEIDRINLLSDYIYYMKEIIATAERAILDHEMGGGVDLLKSRIAEIKSLIEKMEG